jgi:HlyD family secretion protein
MKTRTKAFIGAGVVIVLALAAVFVLRPLLSRRDGLHYVTRSVAYADISATVNETGTVNPVNEVQVGSEVSGTIRTLSVDYNSKVYKGEVLATLDPTTFQAAVESAQANLALDRANLDAARVSVNKAQAELDLANLTVQRDEPLLKQGFITQNQFDTDQTAATSAKEDYLSAQAAVKVAQAQIAAAQGQLAQAKYNLSRTVIRSPFDGIVMARNVSVGQTVAASLQTPTLFTLATNLTDMQVDTSVDEADVGSVHAGQPAQITVTAYPNVVFPGTVLQVRVDPTVVQNVVTYDAVVQVHDTSGRLLPGMTAQVIIQVGKREHVPAVPIAALLYRPLAAQPSPAGSGPAGGFGAGVVQSAGAAPLAGAPGSTVTVWVLRNGSPVPVQVVIGLTDGTNVEITGGNLQVGDQVIIAQRRGEVRGQPSRNQGGGAQPGAAPPTRNGPPRGGNSPSASAPAHAPAGGAADPAAAAGGQ